MSLTTAVLVTSIEESELVKTTVGSFVVLPSVSSPSSDTSVTSFVLPGVLAVTDTLLFTDPVLATFWLIV